MSFNSQQYLELSYAIPTSTTYSSVVERSVEPVSRLSENITVSTVSYTSTPQESSSQRLLEGLCLGIRSVIASIVGKDVLRSITVYNDPDYGYVIKLVVDLDAKQALELWQKLVEIFPYKRFGIVIGVKWTRRSNVSEDELVNYIVKIMRIAGLRPVARKLRNIVEEMLEEREKRYSLYSS
jgi:hypothetical protein